MYAAEARDISVYHFLQILYIHLYCVTLSTNFVCCSVMLVTLQPLLPLWCWYGCFVWSHDPCLLDQLLYKVTSFCGSFMLTQNVLEEISYVTIDYMVWSATMFVKSNCMRLGCLLGRCWSWGFSAGRRTSVERFLGTSLKTASNCFPAGAWEPFNVQDLVLISLLPSTNVTLLLTLVL